MKFKRLSTHFWELELNGMKIVGTWDKINQEAAEKLGVKC